MPKLYKHKKDNHFKYNLPRVFTWLLYTIYVSIINFHLPFFTLGDITGGSTGHVSYIGQFAFATTLQVIITNWALIFILYRETNYTVGFMTPFSVILFLLYLFLSNASGDWNWLSVSDFLWRSPLTIPCVFLGVMMNVLPVYIVRRYETVIFAPEFYKGPSLHDFGEKN